MMRADENGEPIGVIIVNKPKNWTSFDVCGKLRGILKTKRIGHTGTLDPLATGVLPVLIGKAAKASDILPESGKSYRAGFKLGLKTDTQDITGTVIKESYKKASRDEITEALGRFKGSIMQTPPMYSAVKVNGKKLYELAREGVEIERPAREVFISRLELLEYDCAACEGTLAISCSKGTYVRTIIDDLGEALGTFGVMTSLVRTKANGFDISESLTIEQIQALSDEGKLFKAIRSLESIFEEYPRIKLDKRKTALYKNGVKFRPEQLMIKGFDENSRFRIISDEGELISIAYVDTQKNEVRSLRNFY